VPYCQKYTQQTAFSAILSTGLVALDDFFNSLSFVFCKHQAKPLIPLQTDWDDTHERRYLTCYMFPQRPINEIYEEGKLPKAKQIFFINTPICHPILSEMIKFPN